MAASTLERPTATVATNLRQKILMCGEAERSSCGNVAPVDAQKQKRIWGENVQNNLSDAELIALLRKQVSAWFSNTNLLLFEELLRRYERAKKEPK